MSGKEVVNLFDSTKLSVFKKFKLTRTGLVFSDELSFDECENVLKVFRGFNDASMWALGDLLRHSELAHGEKYTQLLEETEYEEGTLKNAQWVANAIDIDRRHEKLSFSHHKVVAPCKPAQQDKWLERAEEGNWSVKKLKDMVNPPDRKEDLECVCPRCKQPHVMKRDKPKADF